MLLGVRFRPMMSWIERHVLVHTHPQQPTRPPRHTHTHPHPLTHTHARKRRWQLARDGNSRLEQMVARSTNARGARWLREQVYIYVYMYVSKYVDYCGTWQAEA